MNAQCELNKEQEALLKQDGFISIFLLLTEREATLDQLCELAHMPKIKVSFILKKLLEYNLIKKHERIKARNVLETTYNVVTDKMDLSSVVEDSKISMIHYLSNKVQNDLEHLLDTDLESLAKVSYVSSRLSQESYIIILQKIEELLELISKLEGSDQKGQKKQSPANLFVSFYIPNRID